MQKIPFSRPAILDNNLQYVAKSFANGWTAGNGPFTKTSELLLEEQLGGRCNVLLTTSCTHALEMSAILLNLLPGDEIIVPSYTFVSSALAFYMHGAKIVFADIRPNTLNIDESKIEVLITKNTRAIVVVHYAGVACEMKSIMHIADQYQLYVIEDNAHGLYGQYQDRKLGTIGHMATQSFHETKNISCGEGGALILTKPDLYERAEIIREKGTNRSRFFRDEIDKYTWVDKGSSYVLSDILAAILYHQLNSSEKIQKKRKTIWETYNKELNNWCSDNKVTQPYVPKHCDQTYHMYYLLFPDLIARTKFISYLSDNGISASFHYQPLHTSDFGKQFSTDEIDICPITTNICDRIVRLPLYYNMSEKKLLFVIKMITAFNFK